VKFIHRMINYQTHIDITKNGQRSALLDMYKHIVENEEELILWKLL